MKPLKNHHNGRPMSVLVVAAFLLSLSLAQGVQSPSSWRESREDKSADLQDRTLVATEMAMELSQRIKSGTLDPNILKGALQEILHQQIARVEKSKEAKESRAYIQFLQAALDTLTLTGTREGAFQLSLLGHTFVVDETGNVYSPQQVQIFEKQQTESPFIEITNPYLTATSA